MPCSEQIINNAISPALATDKTEGKDKKIVYTKLRFFKLNSPLI